MMNIRARKIRSVKPFGENGTSVIPMMKIFLKSVKSSENLAGVRKDSVSKIDIKKAAVKRLFLLTKPNNLAGLKAKMRDWVFIYPITQS